MLLNPRTTTLVAWIPWVMMSTPGAVRMCSTGVATVRSWIWIRPHQVHGGRGIHLLLGHAPGGGNHEFV